MDVTKEADIHIATHDHNPGLEKKPQPWTDEWTGRSFMTKGTNPEAYLWPSSYKSQ